MGCSKDGMVVAGKDGMVVAASVAGKDDVMKGSGSSKNPTFY